MRYALLIAAVGAFVAGCGGSSGAPEISLEAAVLVGDDDAVRGHVAAGTELNTRNAQGDTPLSVACVVGRVVAARALIDGGADLETRNASGTTPLYNAAFFCHPEIVRALLDAGADVDTTDANGTPIRDAMGAPWEVVEGVYVEVYRAIGMPFDAEHVKATRPRVAAMLR